MWDWSIADAIDQGATAFVGLGDVVEGDPDGEERYELGRRYREMKQHGPVYEVLGNHEERHALRWLEFLGVTVAWDSFVVSILADQAYLLLAPYARKGHTPYDQMSSNRGFEASSHAAAEILTSAVRRVRQSCRQEPLIVAGHWTVNGARLSENDHEIHAATEMVVPVEAFDEVDLAVSGHIHKAQEIAPNIVYTGSLYRCSFAEAKDEKSYLLITVDGDAVTWARRPIPCREMVEHRLVWTPELAAALQEPGAFGNLDGNRNWEVKITLEIPQDQFSTFDRSVFAPLEQAASYFVLDKQIVTAQRTRNPEIARAQTLADQFFVWIEATQGPVDPARRERLQQKLAHLE